MTDTNATAAAPNLGGRPTLFTPDLGLTICHRLMGGETLSDICLEPGMPHRTTVHLWILKDKDFKALYNDARDAQCDTFADEIIQISNKTEIGKKTTSRTKPKDKPDGADEVVLETVSGDMVEHRKLKIDARKWFTARVAPKRYGDRIQQEHTGLNGGPLQIVVQGGLPEMPVGDAPAKPDEAAG